MTKAFVYQVRYLPETEQTYLLERVDASADRHALPYAQDDGNWMALLSRQTSFRFFGHDGSFSAQLERHTRQDADHKGRQPYWSAYRKAHGVQIKIYLGQDLTTSRLEAVAARVQARLKEKLGLSDEDPLLTARSFTGKSKEQQQVSHLLTQLEKKDQMIADLRQELGARDQMIADLRQELGARDQMITDLRREKVCSDQEMVSLKQKLLQRPQTPATLAEHSRSQGKRRKPHPKRS